MVDMLSCIIHLILPRHNGQKFTEYEWYAPLGSYLMQCSGVFDEYVCSYAPLGGNCNCALLGRKCAIVCNCAILGVKSSIGHLLCAIMCNCTTVHLCRSGGQLCNCVSDDVCPKCTSGWQRESKLTAPGLFSSSCKQLVLHCRAQMNIASWYKWWGDIHNI